MTQAGPPPFFSSRMTHFVASAGMATLLMGCPARYNIGSAASIPTEAEIKATPVFAYKEDETPDQIDSINKNYGKIAATCTHVRSAMLREVDGIATKNLAIGAIFSAATATLSVSSGIYSIAKGADANPAVSAVLGLGATATTVPTFFYFGADERQKVVQERITTIDKAREQVNQAWQRFKGRNREYALANGKMVEIETTLQQSKVCEVPDDAAKKKICDETKVMLDDAKRKVGESQAAWMEAADGLDDAVTTLGSACN